MHQFNNALDRAAIATVILAIGVMIFIKVHERRLKKKRHTDNDHRAGSASSTRPK
jgi:hypothetical protein